MNSSIDHVRRFVVVFMMLFGLMAALPVAASAQGNSDSAYLCQKGGHAFLVGAGGETFENTGQCTSYAASGGQLSFVNGIVVPAGHSVTFSNAVLSADNGIIYGYAVNGVMAGELGSKEWVRSTVYPADATVGPFKNAALVTVYLYDTTCDAMYDSDSNHAIVSGSAPTFQVDIADAGGFCEREAISVQWFTIGNLSVTVTVHP
jgi:hypothetical protein